MKDTWRLLILSNNTIMSFNIKEGTVDKSPGRYSQWLDRSGCGEAVVGIEVVQPVITKSKNIEKMSE
jgi:hypothetical protein